MTIWRMAFRVGNRGYEMWPQCLKYGVAAITYNPLAYTDLSKYPQYEPKELWAQLSPTQKASISRIAYEMKKGDEIFVKHGGKIIGRGTVKGRYEYDSSHRIREPGGVPWSHQVPVKWETDFTEVKILFGGEQVTVLELSQEDLSKLEANRKETEKSNQRREAIEGGISKREALFRDRNRTLIQAKKMNSDYRCEACGFNFYEEYGDIGKHFIIAHHIVPISTKGKPTKTTLDDIALLCANCHAMVHVKHPPLSISDLKVTRRE